MHWEDKFTQTLSHSYTHTHTHISWLTKQVILTKLKQFQKAVFAVFSFVNYCLVEPWQNNMIMNDCFHADFSQWLRRLLHEREAGRVRKEANKSVSESRATCLASEILWSKRESELFSPFLLKFLKILSLCPSSPPSNILLLCLSLGELSKQSETERGKDNKSPQPPSSLSGDRSFLFVELGLALTHWLFYLMWNSMRRAEPRQLFTTTE